MARDPETLSAQLTALRAALEATPLGPTIEGSAETRRLMKQLGEQIDDYLLPRLANLDAPLLAAVGGSTGAGKSTITNSLVGAEVSRAGLLRPTTRVPVLVCHPEVEQWFTSGGVLPGLPRITGDGAAAGQGLRVVTSAALPEGLAVLDTPDIDSVELANHELAGQLLGAADLWLFVTTAARYADAVPWDYLTTAHERAIAIAIAVNRIPRGGEPAVMNHFATMLQERGLEDAIVFAVAETDLDDGRIPQAELGELRAWLLAQAADAADRRALVQGTVAGAVASIPGRLERIAAGVEREAATLTDLELIAADNYEKALAAISARVEAGTVLRAEVLARWHEYVGGGQIMKSLQGGISRVRDALRSAFRRGPSATAAVQGELTASLVTTIVEAADGAADATVARWESSPAGRQLLSDDARTLARPGAALAAGAEHEIKAWQDYVLDLIRAQAEGKRMAARALSLGINTIGVSLMVVMFAHTGGITGGEVAVAGGAATVSQTLLTAIFGENAVRDLARQARRDLVARVERLLATDAARFRDRTDGGPTATDADRLRTLGTALGEGAS